MVLSSGRARAWVLLSLLLFTTLFGGSNASLGDRLPEFRECVNVCQEENCQKGDSVLPLHLRFMFWTCPAECDYTCQHVVTKRRVSRDPPMISPVLQFHGKWPFHRMLGMQEPFSVLFSMLNFLAHWNGMSRIKESIPAWHSLRKYYLGFGYIGLASWTFSSIFHTRDFPLTEKLDYFAAGASVLYGIFSAVIRIRRLDQNDPPHKPTLRRAWTAICAVLYILHVCYLSFWSWNYTYNMAANVAVGVVQNILWTSFSVYRYNKSSKLWTTWPGMIVVIVTLAMSLELFDFPPWNGLLDAHSLWHLGTVAPTVWWYSFLIKDVQDDMTGQRYKA